MEEPPHSASLASLRNLAMGIPCLHGECNLAAALRRNARDATRPLALLGSTTPQSRLCRRPAQKATLEYGEQVGDRGRPLWRYRVPRRDARPDPRRVAGCGIPAVSPG
jgi:hypothetical protein